jgi:carotenoid 1,2-hydratase
VIAFIGSVFSPYYAWSGRTKPEDHVAVNVALYHPEGNAWTMTERGQGSLFRSREQIQIGPSRLVYDEKGLEICFDEVALPWPGQRLLPSRISGRIRIAPEVRSDLVCRLDPEGHHVWHPVYPRARVQIESNYFPPGGWTGEGYHDFNAGDRPPQVDFCGWDWARGTDRHQNTVLCYDAQLKEGSRHSLALSFGPDGRSTRLAPPPRFALPASSWRVRGGIYCDAGKSARVLRKLEDTPFYSRALVGTSLWGKEITLMHETLDCARLDNPLVRLMLPFRMPRRPRSSRIKE